MGREKITYLGNIVIFDDEKHRIKFGNNDFRNQRTCNLVNIHMLQIIIHLL